MSAYKEKKANKQSRDKSHDCPIDMAYRETPPPLDRDPKVVKPMARPFVLDHIESEEETKERKNAKLIPYLH